MKKGYITLLSMLVVGAVGMAVTISLISLGINSSRTGFAFEQSEQSKTFAKACEEEALQQIFDSSPYTGSSSITFTLGSCSYTVTSQGGQNRTINVTSNVGTLTRKIQIVINQIIPNINISSWQEVSSF